jgi:hypothetical protein
MEPVVHDALSFYQRSLKDGDNAGLRYLESMGLLDADLLGLANREREHLHNCLVLPVYDLEGALVDLYGLRIRSTDIRAVFWKEPRQGLIGGRCLNTFQSVILCEYPLYWLQCVMLGKQNAVACRSADEMESAIKLLHAKNIRQVHYLGRKFRTTSAPLLAETGITVDYVSSTGKGPRINPEAVRCIQTPDLKDEISLSKETENHLFFKTDDTEYRIERSVIVTPNKKAHVRSQRGKSQFIDRMDFTTAKSRSHYAKACAVKLQVSQSVIEEQLGEIADLLDKMHVERLEGNDAGDEGVRLSALSTLMSSSSA